jgi:hypothetical protein
MYGVLLSVPTLDHLAKVRTCSGNLAAIARPDFPERVEFCVKSCGPALQRVNLFAVESTRPGGAPSLVEIRI